MIINLFDYIVFYITVYDYIYCMITCITVYDYMY